MKNRLLILIPILLVIVIGITFAWWTWTSTNTDVTFTVQGVTVTYEAGNDITGIKLIPVSTKEKGVTDNTAISKDITVSASKTLYFDLNMNLEVFNAGLQHQSLKWEIYTGNTLVNSGNFGSSVEGDTIKLLHNREVGTTSTTYKLYIWIDGNQDNPTAMMNQNYKFVLGATATNQEPVNMLMVQPRDVQYCRQRVETSNELNMDVLGKKIPAEINQKIVKIFTVNNNDVPANALVSWDVSEAQNGSIMAWFVNDDEDNTKFDLYIGQDGGIIANADSSCLFAEYYGLKEIDLSNLNTSYVTNMYRMISEASYLKELYLGDNFDTSNVTNMSRMLSSLYGLTNLNLGDNFDTSNVTNMSGMLSQLYSITNLNLGNKFKTNNVTDMSYMFSSNYALNKIYSSEDFVITNVLDSTNMFSSSSNLLGGNNTQYDPSHLGASYAKIDRPGVSGYFTDISELNS